MSADPDVPLAGEVLLRPVRPGNAFEDTVGRLLQTIRLGVLQPGKDVGHRGQPVAWQLAGERWAVDVSLAVPEGSAIGLVRNAAAGAIGIGHARKYAAMKTAAASIG